MSLIYLFYSLDKEIKENPGVNSSFAKRQRTPKSRRIIKINQKVSKIHIRNFQNQESNKADLPVDYQKRRNEVKEKVTQGYPKPENITYEKDEALNNSKNQSRNIDLLKDGIDFVQKSPVREVNTSNFGIMSIFFVPSIRPFSSKLLSNLSLFKYLFDFVEIKFPLKLSVEA